MPFSISRFQIDIHPCERVRNRPDSLTFLHRRCRCLFLFKSLLTRALGRGRGNGKTRSCRNECIHIWSNSLKAGVCVTPHKWEWASERNGRKLCRRESIVATTRKKKSGDEGKTVKATERAVSCCPSIVFGCNSPSENSMATVDKFKFSELSCRQLYSAPSVT